MTKEEFILAVEDWFTHDLWELVHITHWMPLPSLPSSSEIPNNCEKGGEENENKGDK